MLKISHLQKNYRGFSLDCFMEVQPGMITGLIGRNGSGKSTTFKALLGLIHPDGGEIEVFGKKAEELKSEDKQKLGVVFADSGFSMYLTAAGVANIMKSIYPEFDREKFLQQCRRFNLLTDKKIKEFSTGMKAKFKVLAALSHKAELLILDEPAVQVDGYSLDAQKDKLRKYAEFQDMEIVGEYSDEGHSGKNIKGRQEFMRMLNDIEDGKDGVDFVLVFKLS